MIDKQSLLMSFALRILFVALLSIIFTASSGCNKPEFKEPAVFSVDPALRLVKVGSRFKYTVGQFDEKGRKTNYPVIFKSADPKVATVDKNGLVTAKKSGSIKIEAGCKDKSFTLKVDVMEELYSMNLPDEGIIADNGTVLLHNIGGMNDGYHVNYFGDSKGYLQMMFSIKNVSPDKLLVDPDHFAMLGSEKETVISTNSKLNKPKYKGLLRKQWLEPGQTIENLVIFMRPRFNFNFNKARIVYDDHINPKIVDSLQN